MSNPQTGVRAKDSWFRPSQISQPPEEEIVNGFLEPETLLVRVDNEQGRMPAKGRAGDAGLDLFVSERTVIRPGEFRDVPCGISLQLPAGHWGRITGRSSTLRQRGLLVNEAVIDNGYVGPIYTGAWNLGGTVAIVEAGERIAQLVLHEICQPPVVRVLGELTSRDGRGDSGFGSTGK